MLYYKPIINEQEIAIKKLTFWGRIIIDSEYAVVSTPQDVVVDSGKTFLGMSKEAYKEAKIQYYKYKIRQLEKEKGE
jgi:hypothetical protein